MDRKIKGKILLGIGLTQLLAGCMNAVSEKKNTQGEVKDKYASVQEYTGEDYFLNNGDENDKIAEGKSGEVEKAVKNFFLEKYKTEVKVHNLVGNVNGVTVFVESIGLVHFYSYAIVPINGETIEILSGEVMSQEDVVEEGIREGLYRLVFNEEFHHLDDYLGKVVSENKVTGRTIQSLQKVGGSGFMTPYYTMTSFYGDEAIQPVYDLYMKDPDAKIEDLKSAFDVKAFDEEYISINIMLYMEDEKKAPSKRVLQTVSNDIEKLSTVPKGTYQIIVNDNGVHKETSEGYKENSIMTELIKSK